MNKNKMKKWVKTILIITVVLIMYLQNVTIMIKTTYPITKILDWNIFIKVK